MALIPISIKFTPEQREWLQAQANQATNGRIGALVKSIIDGKRLGIKRQPRKAS